MMGAPQYFPVPAGPLNFDAWRANAADHHIDPYTIWALQTNFRNFIIDDQVPQVLDFLIELDQPLGTGTPVWPPLPGQGPQLQVPPIYESPLPGETRKATHVTLRVPMKSKTLEEVVAVVGQLLFLKGVKRAQIGFPQPDEAPIGGPPVINQPKLQPMQPSPKVVLGVLDDGCPFGHAALLTDDSQARVVALWDQSSCAEDANDPSPEGLGYGRQRLQLALNKLLKKHRECGILDEESLYMDPSALQRQPIRRASHAAAVIPLLAGLLARLPWRPTIAHPSLEPVPAPPADDAGQAPLVVVQFPREQINVVGARWLVVRALDGLRYIARASEQLAPRQQPPLPLAVNLSYGSMVGAHDGTGLFETAMAELAEAHKRMAIVLAAGNSYGTARASDSTDDLARIPSGRHAVHRPPLSGGKTRFRLYIPPNKPIETYLEIWFDQDDAAPGATQFLTPTDVSVVVTSPIGDVLQTDQFNPFQFDDQQAGQSEAGLFLFTRVAQSNLRSMALLVVAATQMSVKRVEAVSGEWTVEVTNHSAKQLRVQGWVERDLVSGAARRSQAARLLADPENRPESATLTDCNTLNNIATGAKVFRAGALTATGNTFVVSPYSSAAETAPKGPEFSAVADASPLIPGIRVSGNLSGSAPRINGTSVAAPQAARWLANRLATNVPLATLWAEIAASHQGDARRGRIDV